MRGMLKWSILLVALLVSCGGAPAITAQQAFDRLQAAGLATNARTAPGASADSPALRCTDRLVFDIPDAPGNLAVIDICPKEVGAALIAAPTSPPAAGINVTPLRFQSAGGSVVVTLSALVPPAVAARIGREVQLIPE
jgi:hypothetical protein